MSWAVAQERRLRQSGQRMPQGKMNAFDESDVEGAREPECLELVGRVSQIAQAHATLDPSETAAIGFLDLIIQQVEGDLPTGFAGCHIGDPLMPSPTSA